MPDLNNLFNSILKDPESQPLEVPEHLALRRNRSLHSRLHHRLEIAPLTPDDTAEHLRLRLKRAGW